MLYHISNGQTAGLQTPFTTDGIMIFQSASLIIYPSAASTTSDTANTTINLSGANGDVLLHMSFRRNKNIIVFNTLPVVGGWGSDEKVTLADKFVAPRTSSTTVTVYDHGDRFQILIDYRTVHYYVKRIRGDVVKIAYGTSEGQDSLFSNPIAVRTYSSLGGIAARDD